MIALWMLQAFRSTNQVLADSARWRQIYVEIMETWYIMIYELPSNPTKNEFISEILIPKSIHTNHFQFNQNLWKDDLRLSIFDTPNIWGKSTNWMFHHRKLYNICKCLLNMNPRAVERMELGQQQSFHQCFNSSKALVLQL